MTSLIIRCIYIFPSVQTQQAHAPESHIIGEAVLTVVLFRCVLQLREYCLRLRNMVASDATKDELSDAVDSMIEEVRLKEHSQLFPVA